MTVETKKSKMAVLMILCLDEGDDNIVPALVSVSNRIRRCNIRYAAIYLRSSFLMYPLLAARSPRMTERM